MKTKDKKAIMPTEIVSAKTVETTQEFASEEEYLAFLEEEGLGEEHLRQEWLKRMNEGPTEWEIRQERELQKKVLIEILRELHGIQL